MYMYSVQCTVYTEELGRERYEKITLCFSGVGVLMVLGGEGGGGDKYHVCKHSYRILCHPICGPYE